MIIDHLFTRTLFESQTDHITQFASNAHEEWRRNFDPTGTKPRIKKNSDGTEGDINVPFADLHPDWQKENLAAAHAAHRAVKHFGRDMEKAAEYVHNEWMKRNPKADYNAAQHVPYDDLPEDEKEKDRVHVRTMMQLMGHRPEQGVAEGLPGGLSKSDYTPGATVKNPNTSCKRCNGRGTLWKAPDGKILPANDVPGAKKYKCGACDGIGMAKKEVDEGNEWQGNRGNSQAGITDHTFDEAKQYIKGNYPFHRTYNVSRVEPGMRYHANPEKVANKTQSLVTGINGALDYLQVKQNPMMSGSTQVTPSIGYSWHTHENPANGIAILYYEDRGMGNDAITIAAKDRNNLKGAVQVCRDAGVIPTPKVKKQDLDEGNMPQSVIKIKQKYADMSDQEFHAAHKNKSEDDLKNMAWRHGYGKGSNHYVNRHKKGGGQLNELSTDKLAQYKTAAAKDAKQADQAGNIKRGDKRFDGIVKATKKQFDNDVKKVGEGRQARRSLMARIVNSR